MGMFGLILQRRDNFILAAINAEDPKMKSLWLKRAESMNNLLNLYSKYEVREVS